MAIRIEIQKCADVYGIIEKLNRESGHKSRLARFDAEIEEANRELRRISSLRQAVYDDYAAKLLTVSEYQFATEKYAADTEKQKSRLEAAEREKAEFKKISTPINKWLAEFIKFIDSNVFTAEMAQAMIERVTVSDRDRVTIRFKFRDEMLEICEYSRIMEEDV